MASGDDYAGPGVPTFGPVICFHKECSELATDDVIDTPNGHWRGCAHHRRQLEHAQKYQGGYSTVNTEDNIFGWRTGPSHVH